MRHPLIFFGFLFFLLNASASMDSVRLCQELITLLRIRDRPTCRAHHQIPKSA